MTAKKPAPARVEPKLDSRLEQLRGLYAEAQEAMAAAKERVDELNVSIKAEMMSEYPEARVIDLHTPRLGLPPLRLHWKEQWRLDAKRMKSEDPELYVRWAKKSGYWELREVS